VFARLGTKLTQSHHRQNKKQQKYIGHRTSSESECACMHMCVTGTHGMAERRTGFAEDDGELGVRRSERWKEDGREGPRPTEHMRRHSCSTGLRKKSLPIRLIKIKLRGILRRMHILCSDM
jgi:hypothetical protein